MHRLATAACAFASAAAFAQTPGPQVATFFSAIDDSDQPYALYVPKNYDASRAWPLVISLHGNGSNHRLNLRRVFGVGNRAGETDAEATRYFPPLRDVDFLVASPLARGSMGYQGIPEQDVLDVLADVKRRFRVDEDRVYLTGLSMGGGGTLWMGLTRPDLWAAIAVVCPSEPPGLDDYAGNALNLPVHLFHGDQDPSAPVEVSRRWHKLFLDGGGKAEYIEYPGVRHNAWDFAYRGAAIFDWFAPLRRNRFPDRVRYAASSYRYHSAYWVRLDALTPGIAASVDARFAAANRIEIATSQLDGLTLRLEGHPKFAPGRPLEAVIDGSRLRIPTPQPETSFTRAGGAWSVGLNRPGAGMKRAGFEGPIADAVASRHVYVYGTGGASAEEAERRRAVAAHAAVWGTQQNPLLLHFAVQSDAAVRPAEMANANLVLFGTRETNSLIAKYAPQLPLELNAGAADYGLLFVTSVDGRYVVVNSGLPWWTGVDDVKWGRVRYNPAANVLLSFEDFLLFKGSLSNVIARGRFDNHWKLPPEAAEAMRATGAVAIRQ